MKNQTRPHYKSEKATIAAGSYHTFIQRCPSDLDRILGIAVVPDSTTTDLTRSVVRVDVGNTVLIQDSSPLNMLYGNASVAPNDRFFKFEDFYASCQDLDVKTAVQNNGTAPITITIVYKFVGSDNSVQ